MTQNKENKVTFGLQDVHIAIVNEVDNQITYETPYALKGAIELSLDPQGEEVKLKADNIVYYSTESNDGYTGNIKFFELPENFYIDILGEKEENGIVVEKNNAKRKKFALLFQFEGDEKSIRHALLYCSATRPKFGSSTKDGSNYNNVELNLTILPRPTDGVIKFKTNSKTSTKTYEDWFKAVPTTAAVGG